MEIKEFKNFCKEEFIKKGFKKIKNGYYLKGPKDVLCGIFLQKSDYGDVYYINYCYHILSPQDTTIPSYYDMDMDGGRIKVKTKTQKTKEGDLFWTVRINYKDYSKDELRYYFEKEFEEMILPPIFQGKKYILENLNKLYFLTLHPDRVLKKLEE